MENQRTTVLLVLDISAAFDTIDFSTLFDRLRLDFGLGGVALDWLRSFLIGRTQYVGVGTSRSSPATCLSGVPKGSVLGPYTVVDHVVAAHHVHLPQYTDDTLLYVAVRTSDVSPFDVLLHCVSDISRWFLENGMLFNPNKTKAVLFRTSAQWKQIDTSDGIDVAGIKVAFSSTVKLLSDIRLTKICLLIVTSIHRTRMQLSHESSQAHKFTHQPLRRQNSRSRSCDVTIGQLKRSAVRNFRSKRGTPCGRT